MITKYNRRLWTKSIINEIYIRHSSYTLLIYLFLARENYMHENVIYLSTLTFGESKSSPNHFKKNDSLEDWWFRYVNDDFFKRKMILLGLRKFTNIILEYSLRRIISLGVKALAYLSCRLQTERRGVSLDSLDINLQALQLVTNYFW